MAKLIVDNELDDLWRRENPETSEFTRYDRSSGTRYRVDRIYTDIKAASNTRINHIVVSFTDHYNAIFIDRFSSQTKIKKIHGILIIFLYVSLSSPQLQILFFSNTKNNHSSASDWWENTKSSFKDVRTFSENSRKYWKLERKTYTKKENFKLEIKPMIENLNLKR